MRLLRLFCMAFAIALMLVSNSACATGDSEPNSRASVPGRLSLNESRIFCAVVEEPSLHAPPPPRRLFWIRVTPADTPEPPEPTCVKVALRTIPNHASASEDCRGWCSRLANLDMLPRVGSSSCGWIDRRAYG